MFHAQPPGRCGFRRRTYASVLRNALAQREEPYPRVRMCRHVGRDVRRAAAQVGRPRLVGMKLGVSAASTLGAIALAATGTAAPRAATAAEVQGALLRDGYPARIRCGMGFETVPPLVTRGHQVFEGKVVRKCWVIVERDGYHVSVSLFKDAATAHVSYEHIQNRWATNNWRRAIGNALISSYRLPSRDRVRISRAISALT
jgi:hypothetical protein